MKSYLVGAAGAALLQFAFSQPALAQAARAIVEAVQSPAWIERGGERLPVAPGMALSDRDQVTTGANSRLLLRMPEGSTVKLGENARYRIDQQSRRGDLYAAAMNVFQGAFRYTTDVMLRFRGKRDVSIRFATVTAGIRGTDVWGKSDVDREIVCLIDGRVEVQRGSEPPIEMNQPLSFYIAPAGKVALPVAPVAPEQIREWAAETEIQPGRGALRRGGLWGVTLASADTQPEALRLYDAVRAAGYAASIRPAAADGRTQYAIRIAQLPSRAEAERLAEQLRGRFGQEEPRVSR
ncbi:MAG: SPOR domain-containing protein [Burkholderiales bacterium]|nr:SPOR domain-containing protein [Burkholderiales bacterium]